MEPQKAPLTTQRLAILIRFMFPRNITEAIYDLLQKTVYGIPGKALRAEDLVHDLAREMGYPDPAEKSREE